MAFSLDRYSPYALAALRIITAALFISHGLVKLSGFPQAPRRACSRWPPCWARRRCWRWAAGSSC
jgi:uncharacterized membrane protein YphA (DoxX/SURF4 family)